MLKSTAHIYMCIYIEYNIYMYIYINLGSSTLYESHKQSIPGHI